MFVQLFHVPSFPFVETDDRKQFHYPVFFFGLNMNKDLNYKTGLVFGIQYEMTDFSVLKT